MNTLAPLAALDYFRSLIPLPGIADPGQWSDDLHRVAFTLAEDTDGVVLEKVQAALARMLETGEVSQGPHLIDKLLDQAGITPANPGYAENVFRTNAMDAYRQGQHEEVQALGDEFPVWRYLGISDGRERPSHAVHFGKYFPASVSFGEVADSVKGKFDRYQCRCDQQFIHKKEWKRLQEQGATLGKFAERPPNLRQDNSYHCGVAALQAALQSLTGERIAEGDLAKELNTTPEHGTHPDDILRVAKAHGLDVGAQHLCGIDTLRHFTEQGWLVLCPVQMHGSKEAEAAGESGHWVVVYEVADGMVRFQDPARSEGGGRPLPADEWLRRWLDTDGRGRWYVKYGIFLR